MVGISTMDHTGIRVQQVLFVIDLIHGKFHLKEDEIDHLHRNA